MDIKLFARFPSNISREIFLWCFLLLACDGSGGKEPIKNFLYALATSKQFFIGKLYREALEVYFSNVIFHIGNGEGRTSLAWFDKFKIGHVRNIRYLTVDLLQCHECKLRFDSGLNHLHHVPFHPTCIDSQYISRMGAYLRQTRRTNLRRLDDLRTLTIRCLDGYAPLAVPLINMVSQNSPFLKRVVINFVYSGKAPRSLPRSRDYGKNLIATINANFVDTMGVKEGTTEKVGETWVWKAKAGSGYFLQLVQKDRLIWREKHFILK